MGSRIRRARELRHWDQSELARRAGVTPSYVSRLERGEYKRPSAERLDKVASVLNLSVDDLMRSPSAGPSNASVADRITALLLRMPKASSALTTIARGLEQGDDEDAEFVLGHLELLALRFEQQERNRA